MLTGLLLFSVFGYANPVSAEDEETSQTYTDTETVSKEALVSDPFSASAVIDDVRITVEAQENIFPDGSVLSVEKVEDSKVDEAVEDARDDSNVVVTYTYDIKVLNSEGIEVQPVDGSKVRVSFKLDEVDNSNLNTQIYHIDDEMNVEPLEVETVGDVAIVETDGFSYYTVEFTYETKTYVMEGGTQVPLSVILSEVGLSGEVSEAHVSDESLLSVYNDNGEWIVDSLKPFSTTEWLKVTIDGFEYQITLTDSYVPGDSGYESLTFASVAPIATITIDKSKLSGELGTDVIVNMHAYAANATSMELVDGFIVVRNAFFQNTYDTNTPRTQNSSGAKFSALGYCTITYKNAAVLSDGTRKDLILKITDITVAPRIDYEEDETRDIIIFIPTGNSGNMGGSAEALNANMPTISPGFLTVRDSRGALRLDITCSVDGASAQDTYFFTAQGFNLGNYPNNRPDAVSSHVDNRGERLFYGQNNRHWIEQLTINSGISAESGIYVPNDLLAAYSDSDSTLYALPQSRGWENDRSYASGEVAVVDAAELKLRVKSYFAWGGSQTHSYLFSDQVTRNFTSSSGYYGKIELHTDGKIDTTGTQGRPLYGGRYVYDDLNNTSVIDEKRTYDVAKGKEVTYKMTPEDGYVIDKLYIDGKEIDKTSAEFANLSIIYDTAGKPVYYTYTFPSDSVEGDLSDVSFDPRSSMGGCAHTIHVTWQPTLMIDFEKNWNDLDDLFEIRPDEIDISLLQNGNDYSQVLRTDPALCYVTNWTVPYSQPFKLRANAQGKWQYANNGITGYRYLPLFDDYDEVRNTGTLFVYTVEEKMPDSLSAYYVEKQPHMVVKTDTAVSQTFLANNEQPNSYTESSLPEGISRHISYQITNELRYTELFIEKKVIGGSGTFKFKVNLKNPDINITEFEGFTGQDGEFEKDLNVPGGSLVEDRSEVIVAEKLLPDSEYTVTEDISSPWSETPESSASPTHSGKIYDSSNIFGYKGIDNNELYIPEGSGFVDRKGDPVTVPQYSGSQVRYFDDIGAELLPSSNPGEYVYKYGDGKTIKASDIKNLVTITYDLNASVNSSNDLVYKATKSGDNGITEAEDIVFGKPVYGAWFENRKRTDTYIIPRTGN